MPSGISKSGINIGRFKKGRKTWNKGIPLTKEVKEKLRKKMKGRLPWSVGKKRPEITGKKNNNWKGGEVWLVCKECGNKFHVRIARKDKAKFCSQKCYWESEDLKKANSGEKCIFWKGGTNLGNMKIRRSRETKLWRSDIFERDKYLCQMPDCDKTERYLNAHHIKKFSDYPELRFDINNGITLCKKCHYKINGKEEKYEELFESIIKSKSLNS